MVLKHFESFSSVHAKFKESCRTDDWADRLNHLFTAGLLLIFAILVSTAQFVGENRIKCWSPAELKEFHENYINNYCWISNTYYIPMLETIPTDVQHRQEEEITYYQWVPLILAFQALMFHFPNFIWNLLNVHSGLNLGKIRALADETQSEDPKKREEVIKNLSKVLQRWIQIQRPYKHNVMVRAKATFSHIFCLYCNKREGNFLTGLYLCTKVMYLSNVIGQFFLLSSFLDMDFKTQGVEYVKMMRNGEPMKESSRFPRVTMCDFEVRQLNNIQRFTVQCVLPINLFNERVFIFLWFWFVIVAVFTCISFIKWLYLIVIKKNNYDFVKKYLVLSNRLHNETDKQLCRRFAEDYLRLVGPWEGLPQLKKLTRGRSDDWADRMSHIYTVFILLAFAVLISTAHLVGDRIRCWTPAEFTEAYEDYVHNYCWIKNTYYIPQHDYIPEDISLHQEAEITYYQWIPIILLLQVLLFKLPNVFWEILHGGSGIQIGNIIKYAEWSHYKSRDDRRDLIDNLSCTLDKWLDTEQQYDNNCFVRFRSKLSHIFFFFCNKREGTYLTALYICIKGLYLGNIIGQFFMLSAFMATDYNNYGFHWLQMMQSGEDMKVNPRFPKVTLCDFKIRQLQNIKDFTVQCVLPINLFNEMIFIIIWFWLFLMGVISAYSIIKWLYLIVLKRNNYMYVKKYLKLSGRIGPEDKQLCRQFADNYLRDDGCFVARMIALNTTDLVTADLLDCMFDKYRQKVKRAKKSETSLSETTDDGSFMEKENYEH